MEELVQNIAGIFHFSLHSAFITAIFCIYIAAVSME